jgi:membrane protease YdiL (CAAX protease family)
MSVDLLKSALTIEQTAGENSSVISRDDSAVSRLRMFELALVMVVAFSASIVGSLFILFNGEPLGHRYGNARFATSMCYELSALCVLAYVIYRQGRSWSDFTAPIRWTDLPFGLVLISISSAFSVVVYYLVQFGAFYSSGLWLKPKSLDGLLPAGVSVLSILFMVLNPFFEEVIVRAYLMTEIVSFTRSRTAAVMVSTGLQTSYHLYQGGLNATRVGCIFLVFAIYYAQTRRIAPIVLAHMFFDMTALWHRQA